MGDLLKILESIEGVEKVTDRYPLKGIFKSLRLDSLIMNLNPPPRLAEYSSEDSNEEIKLFEFNEGRYYHTKTIDIPNLPFRNIFNNDDIRIVESKYTILPIVFSDTKNIFMAKIILPFVYSSATLEKKLQRELNSMDIDLDSEKENIAHEIDIQVKKMDYAGREISFETINYTMLPVSKLEGEVGIRIIHYLIEKNTTYNPTDMHILPSDWESQIINKASNMVVKTEWSSLGSDSGKPYCNDSIIYGLK